MKIGWLGSRIWEAECLVPWLKVSQAVTLEKNTSRITGISLERTTGMQKAWGSHDLFGDDLDAVCRQMNPFQHCDLLLSYAPVARRKAWMPRPLWTVSQSILDVFDNKLKTRCWLSKAGFPIPPTYAASQTSWPNCSGKMVLQTLGGSCGTSTYIGKSEELRKIFLRLKYNQAIISPFLKGWVINGHVAIFSQTHIEVPWPSIQLVEYIKTSSTIAQPLYAGNDFKAYDSIMCYEEKKKIRDNLKWIGTFAADAGYRGVLGVDLLYQSEKKKFCFLEINARMQGSTGLLSKIERGMDIVPLSVRMFLSLMKKPVKPVQYPNICNPTPGTPVSQSIQRTSLHAGHHFSGCLQPSQKHRKRMEYLSVISCLPVKRRELNAHSMIIDNKC